MPRSPFSTSVQNLPPRLHYSPNSSRMSCRHSCACFTIDYKIALHGLMSFTKPAICPLIIEP